MDDADLRYAAIRLDLGLRRLPFKEGHAVVPGGRIDLEHPTDLEGNKDADYLVARFPRDLPPFWLHRHAGLTDSYARELARQNVAAADVLNWEWRLAKAGQTGEMPWPLTLLRLTLRVLWPVLWLCGVILHLREVGRLSRIGERFGWTNRGRPDCRIVWLHAASLGEAKQLREIIAKLQAEPDVAVVVTTFTASSAAWLAQDCPQAVHQYAPIDTAGCVSRFLDHWRPDTLIIAENELWPEMIVKSAEAGLVLMQVGARPSRTRRRFARSVGFLLNHFAVITCITQKVRGELIDCGVDPARIVLGQDARKATARLPVDERTRQEFARQIGKRNVWVAASTHGSDLDVVLGAHRQLAISAAPLLIIAPRHPRDASGVRTACLRHGFKIAQRSKGEAVADDTDVYIADSFGELGTFFSLTRIVYLGGGLGGEGGHNPYEPAAFGCALLSGPRVENFEHAFQTFRDERIAEFIETPEQLSRSVMAFWSAGKIDGEVKQPVSAIEADLYPAAEIVISQIRNAAPSFQGAGI